MKERKKSEMYSWICDIIFYRHKSMIAEETSSGLFSFSDLKVFMIFK